MATILLGVSGSIAAYKAADLASKLKQKGHDVTAILTKSATELISPNTFLNLTGNRVYIEMFDASQVGQTEHIKLTDRADLVLIAPATANVIAKLALGIADDMLTTTLLAVRCPVIVCPAMNTRMWSHPLVRRNLGGLRALGHHIVEPDAGALACGHVGPGRLADPETIFAAVEAVLAGKAAPPPSRLFVEKQTVLRDAEPALLARERAWRDELVAKGTLVGSGPLGGDLLHLLRAASLDEARATAQGSPLVAAGVVTSDVTEWRVERGDIAPPLNGGAAATADEAVDLGLRDA
jgi:uncharacterized protein YciI